MASEAFARTDHRPWPSPRRPWIARQRWHDLLFAHWPLPADAVRHLVPEGLAIDEREGSTWIGVLPFRMTDVAPRGCPPLPGLSAFPELNVRLYVTRDGKPGIWFLSLDADNAPAVWAWRRSVHLPYFRARMAVQRERERIAFRSARCGKAPLRFEARYGPTSAPFEARPGSLEHFLTERYCLYARTPRGTLLRLDVQHPPWPLQQAEASIARNDLLAPHGLELPGPPALLHFARHLDVAVWWPERT